MILDLEKIKIFIRPGQTDLRKAINGLSVIVQETMKQDPFSGNVYLFCNREKKLLKAVYWDKTGFWLSQKRLEKDKFPWPQTGEEALQLNGEELAMLLKGIDFFKAHKELHYKKVASGYSRPV
jgi:transposase